VSPRKPSGRRPKSFRLDPETVEWLRASADRHDVSESAVVEQALRNLREGLREIDAERPFPPRRPKDSTRRREPEPEKPSWA
jgi:hypothetical protein